MENSSWSLFPDFDFFFYSSSTTIECLETFFFASSVCQAGGGGARRQLALRLLSIFPFPPFLSDVRICRTHTRNTEAPLFCRQRLHRHCCETSILLLLLLFCDKRKNTHLTSFASSSVPGFRIRQRRRRRSSSLIPPFLEAEKWGNCRFWHLSFVII